jgi:[ribosomal protein S18]-alanine N-acetyltransferase
MEPAGAEEKILLRPMRLEDVEQVYAIDVASFSLPWSERSYRYELTENVQNSYLWVAETAGGVVGMIVMWIILDEAHIATIATRPDYRRRGVARRLLVQALAGARERKASLAMLEVRRNNLAAQKLYESFGFVVVGVRPRYYVDNMEDALLMNLDL